MKVDTNSTIRLLRNDKRSIEKSIISSLKTAKEAFFCIAFLKDSGLSLLRNHIVNAVNRNCSITFYIGTDFYQTEPVSLWFLFKLAKRHKNVKFFLLSQDAITFHPKIYLMLSKNRATAIIGSSNLTRGGLLDNIEAAACIETSHNNSFIEQIGDFLKSIEEDDRSQPADPVSISQYERRYATYRKRVKRAEREAKAELARLFNLNADLLQKYLKDYLANQEEQSNWRQRIRDYGRALVVLNSLNRNNIHSKHSFLDEYEKLVGKTGQRGLWHSGSIFRMKNKVAPHGVQSKSV